MKLGLILTLLFATVAGAAEDRYREINGVVYDFSPAMTWQKRAEAIQKTTAPAPDSGKLGGTAHEYQSQQIDAERGKWGGYVVAGKVERINAEGLIISAGDHELLLRNHPQAASLGEGSAVNCLAKPAGQFKTPPGPKGKRHTLPAFDYGKVVASPTGKVVPLPPLSP